MSTAAPLVRLRDVSKTFHGGTGPTAVFSGLSVDLPRGESTSLVGNSGAGKSTLLLMIAGLLLPDSGQIEFDGEEITRLRESERAGLRAGRIGTVMQSGGLIPFLTAAENVELVMQIAHSAARRLLEPIRRLEEVGVAHRAHHRAGQLSGGEAQRVALAMALANNPDLLLADEVTGELDKATANRVMDVIVQRCADRGLTLLFVTHSLDLADKARNRLELVDGQMVRRA
jgi:putative ABC transport system ATP-binding protein